MPGGRECTPFYNTVNYIGGNMRPSEEKARKSLSSTKSSQKLLVQTEFGSVRMRMDTCSNNNGPQI